MRLKVIDSILRSVSSTLLDMYKTVLGLDNSVVLDYSDVAECV